MQRLKEVAFERTVISGARDASGVIRAADIEALAAPLGFVFRDRPRLIGDAIPPVGMRLQIIADARDNGGRQLLGQCQEPFWRENFT
jgi:hypothetical protein